MYYVNAVYIVRVYFFVSTVWLTNFSSMSPGPCGLGSRRLQFISFVNPFLAAPLLRVSKTVLYRRLRFKLLVCQLVVLLGAAGSPTIAAGRLRAGLDCI